MPNSLLYAIATLIWGSTWFAITFQFGSVPASASVAYRFLLAGGLIALWCLSRGERLRMPVRDLGWTVLQGVLLFGAAYMCVYEAERHIASGLMAVLNSAMLVFNLIGMRLFFGRPFGRRASIGAALGILGIALVFRPELAAMHSASLRGVIYGLLAAVLASFGNLVAQRNRNARLPLMPGLALGMLAGGSFALITSIVQEPRLVFDLRPTYLFSLLYLAVFGSVLAFAAYTVLIGRIGAGRAGYIAVAVPILALVLSGMFEGFLWSVWTFAGIACAALGNIIVLAGPSPPAATGNR